MASKVFVVSDLHLGGAAGAGGAPGFQICPARNQRLLADFVGWAGARGSPCDLQLVLAGDVVDFLAVEEGGAFEAFSQDESVACRKLGRILGDTAGVWDALSAFVAAGGALTLLLGNHDVELSLPRVRRDLLRRIGAGRVEFLYDNQALVVGPVLIEHGNRYDCWNAVNHDQLRRIRSRLSRGEATGVDFEVQPGSELVVRVMNPIKRDYSFVDLLKPERAGVLPFLAWLDPVTFQRGWDAVRARLQAARVRFGADRAPVDPDKVAASTQFAPDDDLIALAQAVARGGSLDQVAAAEPLPGFLRRWREKLDARLRAAELDGLFRALRAGADRHATTFSIDREDEEYAAPAGARAAAGARVVVFGHTHLPKRLALPGGALYLNTGTWADLMRVPDAVLRGDPAAGRAELERFADDIANDRLEAWRRAAPTFAEITLDGDRLVDAGVFFFDGPGAVEPLDTAGLLHRLSA